jgi:hypothetical protein
METTKFSGYIQTIGGYIDMNSFNIYLLEIFDDENESPQKISKFLFNLINLKSQYIKKYADSRVWKKQIQKFIRKIVLKMNQMQLIQYLFLQHQVIKLNYYQRRLKKILMIFKKLRKYLKILQV